MPKQQGPSPVRPDESVHQATTNTTTTATTYKSVTNSVIVSSDPSQPATTIDHNASAPLIKVNIANPQLLPVRMQWPAISSRIQQAQGRQVSGKAPRSKFKDPREHFSLRLAGMYGSGKISGTSLSLEYSVRTGSHLLLRPFIGVELQKTNKLTYWMEYYQLLPATRACSR